MILKKKRSACLEFVVWTQPLAVHCFTVSLQLERNTRKKENIMKGGKSAISRHCYTTETLSDL